MAAMQKTESVGDEGGEIEKIEGDHEWGRGEVGGKERYGGKRKKPDLGGGKEGKKRSLGVEEVRQD